MRRALSFFLTYCLCVVSLVGQKQNANRETLRQFWEERLNTLAEEGQIDEAKQRLSLEILERLLDEPLDINTARAEDFRQIPFLNDFQIYQLIHYRTNKRGEKLLLSDLKAIKSWDKVNLPLLLPLLRGADEVDLMPNQAKRLTGGKSKASLLYGRRHKAGDEQYLASPSALALRYQYLKPNKLKLFLGAEQDYCEPWRFGKHRGFDSYAYSFSLDNTLNLERIVVGDFRVAWGRGLCLRQGFRLLNYENFSTYGNKLSSVSGLSEGNKFRGLGAKWQKGKLSLMAFASSRKLDGRIDDEGFIYGLSETGLHRTERDFERKEQVPMRAWGGQLALSLKQLELSLHHLYYDFSNYHLAHATGASGEEALNSIQKHYNTGLSYHWHARKGGIVVSGELARNSLGAFAYVHNTNFHLNNVGNFALGFRAVSPRYWAYYAQTNTHFLRPNNERGLSLSFSSRELINKCYLTTYFDFYKGVKPFANGEEKSGRTLVLKLMHRYNKQVSLEGRCSWKEDKGEPARLRLGLRLRHQLNEHLTMNSSLQTSRAKSEWGYSLAHKFRYKFAENFDLQGSILYHNIPNWTGRIYYYEPQLRYQYQSLFLYRKGFRLAAKIQYHLGKRWFLGAKFAYHQLNHLKQANKEFALLLSFR